jgi:hypothetical protein
MIEITKICTKCKQLKPLSEFHKQKDRELGSSQCKECNGSYRKNNIERDKEWKRQYYKNHREETIQRVAQWRIDNPERKLAQRKKEYAANREEAIKRAKQWVKDNPDKRKEIANRWSRENRLLNSDRLNQRRRELRKKISKDPFFKINNRMRSNIYRSLKRNKNGYHWETLVGYTLNNVKEHLEKLFKDDMSWENMGEWHIDHKIPITLWQFESYTDREFKQCWALCNLQPLWAIENIIKGNRIDNERSLCNQSL